MNATMDRPRGSRLAPRLVIVFAVLACVFGWGHSVSAAVSPEAIAAPTMVDTAQAPDSPAGHAPDHGANHGTSSGPAPAASPGTGGSAADASADHREHHGGHSTGHQHSVFCMASSATSSPGLVPAPDVATLLVTVVPPQTRHCAPEVAVDEQRAPSIAALCILRI